MQLTKYFSCDEHSPFADVLPPLPQQELQEEHKLENSSELPTPHIAPPSSTHFTPQTHLRFYQEHKRLYTVSYHLWVEKHHQIELIGDLNKRIKAIEDRLLESKAAESTHSEENRAKRSRRTAEMIEKKYKCKAPYCEKSYGAEGSLQQHIKIKHPELYSREEEGHSPYASDSDFSQHF